MEHPQVRIYNDDPLSPFQIGPKQPIEGDTALVLLNNQVLRFQLWLFAHRASRLLNGLRTGRIANWLARSDISRLEQIQLRHFTRHSPVVLVRVLPFLQGADQLLDAIFSLIGKTNSWVGGIDAQQLVLDPLTPFDGTAQHIFDL